MAMKNNLLYIICGFFLKIKGENKFASLIMYIILLLIYSALYTCVLSAFSWYTYTLKVQE